MAEPNGTQEDAGRSGAPGTQDPGSQSQSDTTTIVLPSASTSQTQPDYTRELAEARAQAERYKQQLQGWETQSKKHMDDNAALRKQLEQFQGIATTVMQGLQGNTPQNTKPAKVSQALDMWLRGNGQHDALIDEMFDLDKLGKVDQKTIDERVDAKINDYLGIFQRQQTIGQLHPELADPKNPVSQEVFANYEAFANNPTVKMLYGDDPKSIMVLTGPDGTQKTVDIRILDRMAVEAKGRHTAHAAAADTERRSGVGDTVSGTTTRTSGDTVEAIDILEPSDVEAVNVIASNRQMFQANRPWLDKLNLTFEQAQTAAGKRKIAKALFDGLPEEKRTQLVINHRRSSRVLA